MLGGKCSSGFQTATAVIAVSFSFIVASRRNDIRGRCALAADAADQLVAAPRACCSWSICSRTASPPSCACRVSRRRTVLFLRSDSATSCTTTVSNVIGLVFILVHQVLVLAHLRGRATDVRQFIT